MHLRVVHPVCCTRVASYIDSVQDDMPTIYLQFHNKTLYCNEEYNTQATIITWAAHPPCQIDVNIYSNFIFSFLCLSDRLRGGLSKSKKGQIFKASHFVESQHKVYCQSAWVAALYFGKKEVLFPICTSTFHIILDSSGLQHCIKIFARTMYQGILMIRDLSNLNNFSFK